MKMRIDNIIWLPHIVDKLAWKHGVTPQEVEEALLISARSMSKKEMKQYDRR